MNVEELEKLHNLKEKGIITEQEFNEKKSQLMSAPASGKAMPAKSVTDKTLSGWGRGLVLLMNILTLGLFNGFWYLLWRDRLNKFSSSEKLGMSWGLTPLILFGVSIILSNLWMLLLKIFLEEHYGSTLSIGERAYNELIMISDISTGLIDLAAGIILIIAAFKVKKIYEEHFSENINGAAVFFFNTMYLQQKLKNKVD